MAVSGGVDSTALLLALAELKDFELHAAHVNHRLRGADSDADEAFVRDLCASLGIPLHVAEGTLDPERVRARGVEAAAREVRYARLQDIRERAGARYVCTAHQRNDQAETVLMRLITGSGLAGLRGIHPLRDDGFLRPLLDVTREELEAFLRERNVTPRFDRSNDDPRFLRNRVRAFLREAGGIEPLAAIAGQARAVWPLLEQAIDAVPAEMTDDETRFSALPEDEWLRGALLQRHIRRLDPDARDFDAARIARDPAPRISVTKHVELIREGDAIRLRRRAESPPLQGDYEVELTLHTAAPTPAGTLHLGQSATGNRQPGSQPIQLPDDAAPTFTVRNRRPGDRFQPLGMAAPKKLKDFLIDRRIPAGDRDRLPLVLWQGEIVWVAGVEVSEKFKVTSPPAGARYELWIE
ncbi:MAG TPA: tRNA lysidine(34) synthetase TilS [Thermoanaerobaculia bacterium]